MPEQVHVVGTGIVFRNPKPYLRSIVAYHPSLVVLGDDELLATFDLGQAVESLDYHTVVARSTDGGETWGIEGPLIRRTPPATTHTVRVSRLADGSLVGFGSFHHRDDPEVGLVNRDTFGFVPVDLFLLRSGDGGRSWTQPLILQPPLVGPSWEICHPVVELRGGRWLAPTATWRGWKGENPSGDQAVVLISDNQGESWPKFGRTFDGRASGRRYFEQSVIELADGRLLAVAWLYDPRSRRTYPTEYALSEDNGETFGLPKGAGFNAQTCKIILLQDGRLFAAYRRNDVPGLWASLARLEGDRWINLGQTPLWQGAESGMSGKGPSAEELSALKFGYPSMREVRTGEVLLLFWCQEECITNIRWIKIAID